MAKFRQQDVKNPHFSLPFRLGGRNGGAFVNEQDSFEDIQDCVKAVVAYPIGSRLDLPDFGRPDLVFQQVSADLSTDQLWNAIIQWEQRATIDIDNEPVIGDEFVRKLLVRLGAIDA